MKNRSPLRGCILPGLIVLILLGAAAAWWLLRSGFLTRETPPPGSPVQVFLLSPSSGDDVGAGDFVPVSLHASAPAGISAAELFVDGESLGAVSDLPESASWTWQALPPGVHTLTARATDANGHTGESQAVLVNVVVLNDTIDVLAGAGQTLGDVGAGYGVPPDQMAGANPHLNPNKPLADGNPVHVPTDGWVPPPGGGGPGDGVPFSIAWELKITKPAEKSYCYLSDGSGNWEKTPKPPFNFFESLDTLYTQLFDSLPQEQIVLQAQCWGWIGGALEYLGDGQTTFNINDARGQLVMNGQGFQFIGTPQIPLPLGDLAILKMAPPYALRKAKNINDCEAHGGDAALCQVSMKAIGEIVLEWEWQPGLSWPGDPTWLTEINGYELYAFDTYTHSWKYMKEVNPQALKAAALPRQWGVDCYGVEAYAEGPQIGGIVFSDMATFCESAGPVTQQAVENPIDWITTGGEWIEQGCSVDLPGFAFGEQPAVMVGRYIRDYNSGCYSESSYTGGVKFPLTSLPTGAVLQKATLKFSALFVEYSASGKALGPAPQSCVAQVGTSKQDWTGMNTGNHTSKTEISGAAFFSPLESIAAWTNPEVDVTAAVHVWRKFPENNNGFILIPMEAPNPDDGVGKCLSALGNFQLVMDFLAP